MRFLSIALASLSISLTAAAAPAKATAKAPPVTRATCPEALPFALPDDRLTVEWADMEWELWARNAWDIYCMGRESSLACRCADAFGGGPY